MAKELGRSFLVDGIIQVMIRCDIFATPNATIPIGLELDDKIACKAVLESMTLRQLTTTFYLVSSLNKLIDHVR